MISVNYYFTDEEIVNLIEFTFELRKIDFTEEMVMEIFEQFKGNEVEIGQRLSDLVDMEFMEMLDETVMEEFGNMRNTEAI